MRLSSMTGFGRSEGALSDRYRAEVIARSVNHRNLEISVRVREDFAGAEADVRRRVGEACRRGKVDLSVRIRTAEAAGLASLDAERLSALWIALGTAAADKGFPMPADVTPLLRVPGIFAAGDAEDPPTAGEREAMLSLVSSALAVLASERAKEGEALVSVLSELRRRLGERVAELESKRPAWLSKAAEELRARIRLLAEGVQLDPGRLEQEVAILADRADVTEELDRLRIHLGRLDGLLAGEGAPDAGFGKALDFLAQELGREVGTTGAKLRSPEAIGLVLEMKGLVEKIREQVQNVE